MGAMRASLILTHGVVHTVDATDSIAQAVAVAGDRILAVGSNDDVRAFADAGTQRIDLRGRSLVPGFIDAHHHLTWLGNAQEAMNLKAPGMQSIAAIVEELRREVARTPPGAWIRGSGYDQSRLAEGRHPNRFDLDAVSPDNPVVLTRTCGHIVAANSRALAAAGLGLDAPDPDGGRFDRDADGLLTGVCYERAQNPVLVASAAVRGRDPALAPAGRRGLPLERPHEHPRRRRHMTIADTGIAQDLSSRGELRVRTYQFTTVDTADHPHLGILSTGVLTRASATNASASARSRS